jgi:hypothetical protein
MRSRLFLAVTATVGAAVLVAIGLILVGHGIGQNPAYAHGAIDAAFAKLDIKPRTIELTQEKAARVRNAIKHGDYATARKITADVLAKSRLQNWRFYPFTDFIDSIPNVNDAALEARLDAWVAQDKTDAIPFLIRAQFYYDMGWAKRGHRVIRDVQASDLASFGDYMEKGLADVEAAIRLNGGNPYGYYLRLRLLRGFGPTLKLKSAFDAAIAKYPAYYPLYVVVLGTLEPKWGGSVEAMYAFVDRYAGSAPQYSPLKLLYLKLYRDLVVSAAFACSPYWPDREKLAQCNTFVGQKMIKSSLEDQVQAALQLYDHSDKYQFGVAVGGILINTLKSGAAAYSGALLQLAADSMHSDTQLKEDKPDHNNYVIDKAVAESWKLKGFYDNALKKNEEAIKDIKTTAFPSEEEKDLALASIYESMSMIYDRLNQYAAIAAYEKAALMLSGKTDNEHFICYGYYRLKDYVRAIAECTKAIEDRTGNMLARYFRGVAYRDAGQTDAALRDLTVVADSQTDIRTSAAIDLSVIYSDRKAFHKALDVLNKYTYLYSSNTNSKADIAVSYNNRCYAYMQLGELKRALADCTMSLKYGNLPDAYRKEQELVKRLKAGETGL